MTITGDVREETRRSAFSLMSQSAWHVRLSILGFGLLHFGRQLLRIFLFGIEPIALYEYAAAA